MIDDLQNLEERVRVLEENRGGLNYPIDPNSQGAMENTLFRYLKALQFIGGLPIFTASRNDNRLQGEVYLKNISSVRNICFYISGTEYCTTLLNGGLTTADVLAQSGANASVVTAPTPNDGSNHTYSVGGYLAVTSISASTITLQVSFTDENSNSQTLSFFAEGVTTAAISSTGFFPFPPMTLRTKPNTSITIKTIVTGVSDTYDCGGFISQLN